MEELDGTEGTVMRVVDPFALATADLADERRDMFVGFALKGLLANGMHHSMQPADIARMAVKYADGVIEVLDGAADGR